jgi:hypothetical protein|nr:MAG TPA_asm: ParB protein [Caudoviricetes sp.]
MSKDFNVFDSLGSFAPKLSQGEEIYRDPYELVPSNNNFYSPQVINELAESILQFGQLQPAVIDNRDGKDYVIAGHTRRLAMIKLIEEGHEEFRKMKCQYLPRKEIEDKFGEDTDLAIELIEMQTNLYREKTDWEKMQEVIRTEEIVKEMKASGRIRDNVQKILRVSGGQQGRYHAIHTSLCEQLMSEFKENRIRGTVAYELSKLSPEFQKLACELFQKDGTLSLEDAKKLLAQENAEKNIPGQMSIEQATGQLKPEADTTPIDIETQIRRFYDGAQKRLQERIQNRDKMMVPMRLRDLYNGSRIQNGYLNYRAEKACIVFNPGTSKEEEIHWNDLADILIQKYGKEPKPVKMTTIDAPEKTKQKEEYKVEIKKPDGKATAYLNYAAEHLIHSWRDWFIEDYHKRVISVSESPKEIKKKIAGQSRKWHFSTGTGVASINLFDEYVQIWNEKAECIGNFDWFYLAKSIQSMWNAVALEETKKSCQPAAETPDKKQQEDHTGETTETVKDVVNTDLPAAWPDCLKDLPIPTDTEITDFLYRKETRLKEMIKVEEEEPGFPHMILMQQQMLVAGLRIIKNIVEDCQGEEAEEPEQVPLPIMKNNDQRKEWLRNYKDWGIWYEDKNTGIKYYKYDFENGARLIAEEYEPDLGINKSWWTSSVTESYYMHLVGGPEPDRAVGAPKWTYHTRYNKYPNSESELVEFLKEIQK